MSWYKCLKSKGFVAASEGGIEMGFCGIEFL